MVHIPTINFLEKHYNENVSKYQREHEGEIVFLELGDKGVVEHFFKTTKDLRKFTAPFRESYGWTAYSRQIPYQKNSKKLDRISYEI